MYADQKVGVFVDVANILYSLHDLRTDGQKGHFDFVRLLQTCVGERRLSRAVAYSIKSKRYRALNAEIKSAGYLLKAIEPYTRDDGTIKCNADVPMALDAYKVAGALDVVVLVTGDGDFLHLVRDIQNIFLCRVEVVSFRKSTSWKLVRSADEYYDLGTHLEEYLIREPEKTEVSAEKPTQESAESDPRSEQATVAPRKPRTISLRRTEEFYRKKTPSTE